MKKPFVLITFVLLFIIFSCQPYKGLWNTEANIKKVEKGMTYDQVLSIMGKDYSGTSTREGEDGQIYQLLKYNSTGHFTYVFNFINDVLIDWSLEKKPVSALP